MGAFFLVDARVLFAWAVAFSAAGCLRPGPVSPPEPTVALDPEWSERALVFGEDHDHADVAQHQGVTTPNFEILGHDPLISPAYGTTAYGSLCGDAKSTEGGRRIAAIESRSDVGFTLADVTDPLAPKFLGELVMRRTYVYDLAVVPDGRHVVLVTITPKDPDPNAPPLGALGTPLEWRGACAEGTVPVRWDAEDPVPRPLSILLVDITNPAEPSVIDQRPLLGPGHGVYATILDGRTWVVASTDSGDATTSHYEFYEILAGPSGARLNLLSVWSLGAPESAEAATRTVGHTDAWIAKHPGTGEVMAWIAHWSHGVHILDLRDPRSPAEVGSWTDFRPTDPVGDSGQTHSIFVLPELVDGRHYILTGPEHPGKPPTYPTGILWVLDTTDPARPFEVAAWTLPHDVQWSDRLHFSLHYMTAVGRTAFVSAYHAGVWAIDLSPVGTRPFVLLPSAGVFFADRASPKPPAVPMRWTPTNEEVHAFEDGTLVTFDSNSGVYTFRFDASRPMPAPEPWPIRPLSER